MRADALEPRVWGFVSGLLRDPSRLRRGLEAVIEAEERASRGDPKREAKLWHDKLREAERMRSGYQDLTARRGCSPTRSWVRSSLPWRRPATRRGESWKP